MSAPDDQRSQLPRLVLAQWVGVVGPPLIWLMQFEAKYALAGNVSGSRGHMAMVIVGLVGLVLTGSCGLIAYRSWHFADTSPLDRFVQTGERTRFMGALGLLNTALFVLVTITQILAEFFIEPGKS